VAPNGLTPNHAIALQSECPEHMSIEEYRGLVSIPVGFRIQWQNILLQLNAPTINLKTLESTFVFLQTIFQAGPAFSTDLLRDGHSIIRDTHFTCKLIDSLERMSLRLKENWESSYAFSTFISMTAKVLSVAHHCDQEALAEKCLSILADFRGITFRWIEVLRDKSHNADDSVQKAEYRDKAVETALICADSFNVDDHHLSSLLAHPDTASHFVQCCIIIAEDMQLSVEHTNELVSLFVPRWQRLSVRVYPILAQQILTSNNCCLDHALSKAWSAYRTELPWVAVKPNIPYWLTTRKSGTAQAATLCLHYNLMTGELLVDGSPLSRLPAEYECSTTYRNLFGKVALDVMPSTQLDMAFSAKRKHAGYTLHFGMHTSADRAYEPDLLICAVGEHHRFVLTPKWVFAEDFPVAFIDEYVHWYDETQNRIIFCPANHPFTFEKAPWILRRSPHGQRWQLSSGEETLVCLHSSTADLLSERLAGLVEARHMYITLHSTSRSATIQLPRLQLSFEFMINDMSIVSKQWKGMEVDENQSLGTLQGLRERLLLRDQNGCRMILVPEGQVTYGRDKDHVYVHIDRNSATKVQAYHLDDRLGRLVDNGRMQSKLFLCYLHALTSFCLPDPSTLVTGTEQALTILQSAGVHSFNYLSQANVSLLAKIACLTPERNSYPAGLRAMQTVGWNAGIGFLAQHGHFSTTVAAIFDQATRAQVFRPGSFNAPQLSSIDPHLQHRDNIRSSAFRVSKYGAEDYTTAHDSTYQARDCNPNSGRARRAFDVANMFYHRRGELVYQIPQNWDKQLWNFLARYSPVSGPSQAITYSEWTYDARYLQDVSKWLAQNWCSVYQSAHRTHIPALPFSIMIWLTTLAYSEKTDILVIQCLAAFLCLPAIAGVTTPQQVQFDLAQGFSAQRKEIDDVLRDTARAFHLCPEFKTPQRPKETKKAYKNRRENDWHQTSERLRKTVARELECQWPCEVPVFPLSTDSQPFSTYININAATVSIRTKFQTWSHNSQYREYVKQIVTQLRTASVMQPRMPSLALSVTGLHMTRRRGFVRNDDLFASTHIPSLSEPPMLELTHSTEVAQQEIPAYDKTLALVKQVAAQARFGYEKRYAKDLHASLEALDNLDAACNLSLSESSLAVVLQKYRHDCWDYVDRSYASLSMTFRIEIANKPWSAQSIVVACGQWPRVSPSIFLKRLSYKQWSSNSQSWKQDLVRYAVALTAAQQADRLVRSLARPHDLLAELQNVGHEKWSPFEFPEALLMEVESGIMIRDRQWRVAENMMRPPSDQNTVMQLKMGEGKSSVIVPVVAGALAQGCSLVRVFVVGPQAKQMANMLVSKLGGLMDHRVYHLPFSRALQLKDEDVKTVYAICRECASSGGILLVQPEHVLSLKLMGLDSLTSGKTSIARMLLKTQAFFHKSSRDIVDESDENFSVKFELIYTMGLQRPIELSPDRWLCIQQVLHIVRKHALLVQEEIPTSISIHFDQPWAYPKIRFLDSVGEQRTLARAAQHICHSGLSCLPLPRQSNKMRRATFQYITDSQVGMHDIEIVEDSRSASIWSGPTRGLLLLLRGLFAGNILAFAFGRKRWRVNYGVATAREVHTRLAVPYSAKDTPTMRSEFSHPDVAIVLTQLSYYYQGLSDDDLYIAFGHLMKSDQASVEYQSWIHNVSDLPPTFRSLASINLRDRLHCEKQVFPFLRSSCSAVDYFLAASVFPKEMREFPSKLSSSGWDLGEVKVHPTTGFSGTIDSRSTLPISVHHLELDEQRHTNAMVLEYLLRVENSVECIPSNAQDFLSHVCRMNPPVQVILDVGAQVLELTNVQVAHEWLRVAMNNTSVQGVIFFDESHEVVVLNREQRIEPLQSSPYAHDLDGCLVFLDECHTRGTDLHMPSHYRAAVTLGIGVTKDRLTQACMRMRKIGHGQSVVFGVPKEIEFKMLAQEKRLVRSSIDTLDILNWVIAQTWAEIGRAMPLWAAQGRRFQEQSNVWAQCLDNDITELTIDQAKQFLEDESRTLEERYRPSAHAEPRCLTDSGLSNQHDDPILERLRAFECGQIAQYDLSEEQERELAPEIEQERQNQRPNTAFPTSHDLHPDIIAFVAKGILKPTSTAVIPAFEALKSTSAARHLNLGQFPVDLLVTCDFIRTVKSTAKTATSDLYERHVNWILTSTGSTPEQSAKHVKQMLIISPHEAQALLPTVAKSSSVTLHIYAPRPSLDFASLDHLALYTTPTRNPPLVIPRKLILLLNLFAGQRFLESYTEYKELCSLLGLAHMEMDDEDTKVSADGFILGNDSALPGGGSGFTRSPVPFLKVFLSKCRWYCESVERTHVGRILSGGILEEGDFEGAQ